MEVWPAIDLRGGKCVRLRQAGLLADRERLLAMAEDMPTRQLWIQLDEEGQAKRGSDLARRLEDLFVAAQQRRRTARVRAGVAELQQGNLNHDQQKEVLQNLIRELGGRAANTESTDG